jgi:hypothetical protein
VTLCNRCLVCMNTGIHLSYSHYLDNCGCLVSSLRKSRRVLPVKVVLPSQESGNVPQPNLSNVGTRQKRPNEILSDTSILGSMRRACKYCRQCNGSYKLIFFKLKLNNVSGGFPLCLFWLWNTAIAWFFLTQWFWWSCIGEHFGVSSISVRHDCTFHMNYDVYVWYYPSNT